MRCWTLNAFTFLLTSLGFLGFFKDFIYLFLERGRGRGTSVCACLLHTLHWGPGPQPRHVP